MAPFVFAGEVADEEVADALPVEEEPATSPAALGDDEAAAISPTFMGTFMVEAPPAPRLIDPSAFTWLGFMASILRVNMTLAMTRSYDQSGMPLMSISEPQFAPGDPVVRLSV